MQKLVNLKLKSGTEIPLVVEQGNGTDKTVHIKSFVPIHTPKGELSNHHKVNCKDTIQNIVGFLLNYLGRTIGVRPDSADLESISIDNEVYEIRKCVSQYEDVVEQFYLNGIPVDENDRIDLTINTSSSTVSMSYKVSQLLTSSDLIAQGFVVEKVHVPLMQKNGIPRYCRNDLINTIFYYSGVSGIDKDMEKPLRELINEHTTLLKAIAIEMNDIGNPTISMRALKNIVSRNGSKKTINEEVKSSIRRDLFGEKDKQEFLSSYTHHGGKRIQLRKEWF